MSLDMSPEASEAASNKERILSSKTACRGARVSGGDLCEAEAPTEPAGETKSFCLYKKTLAIASAF